MNFMGALRNGARAGREDSASANSKSVDVDFDSLGFEWSLRICLSSKLLEILDAAVHRPHFGTARFRKLA